MALKNSIEKIILLTNLHGKVMSYELEHVERLDCSQKLKDYLKKSIQLFSENKAIIQCKI